MKTDFITEHYPQYIKYLRELVSLPSVFTNPNDVEKAILFCKKTFEENLDNYSIYFDDQHNLIAAPKDIDREKDIIYLSAHVDTVNADPKEWDAPFHPWNVYEDEHEMVARGVNDCKAGVAYQLFISFLNREKFIRLRNVIFTITFKEEGVGKKTSTEIAKQLGNALPLSKQQTYLIVLENNVSVAPIPTLCIYAAERGNFVIKITDSIVSLQQYLKRLTHWNPVCIYPETNIEHGPWQVQTQSGGHVCSVSREENLLTKIILEASEDAIIQAGDEQNFAVVPTEISVAQSKHHPKHSLVVSNRSFDSLEDVLQQLQDIEYVPLKDFSISQGLNVEEVFKQDKISTILENCNDHLDLKLEYTYNVGASDATVIYSSLDPTVRQQILPIVMGPGSRSQRKKSPERLTHGKNETFDKESGRRTITFITKVLGELDCIK